jgi:epoxyqueuosine reductase
VRGAAIWALGQLLSREELVSVKAQAENEQDTTTLDEWRSALGAPDLP